MKNKWFFIIPVIFIIIICVTFIPTKKAKMDLWNLNGDLTLVTWAHAVNSQYKLQQSLKDDKIMMLEADVNSGTLNGSKEVIPIMAHPPDTTSDLSLQNFLQTVIKHNSGEGIGKKGIKLDFKNIDVVEDSLKDLQSLRSQLEFPVWLNADIVKGPGSHNSGVNASEFLSLCNNYFPHLTLSLGWTTNLIRREKNLKYNDESITLMVSTLKSWIPSALSEKKLTFAIRAALAANSLTEFNHLLKLIGKSSTLTIWSHSQDIVDFDKIAAFIIAIGKDRIYLDVPPEQEKEIRSRI